MRDLIENSSGESYSWQTGRLGHCINYCYKCEISSLERIEISSPCISKLYFKIRRLHWIDKAAQYFGIIKKPHLLLPPTLSHYTIETRLSPEIEKIISNDEFLKPLVCLLRLGFQKISLSSGVLTAVKRGFNPDNEELDFEQVRYCLEEMSRLLAEVSPAQANTMWQYFQDCRRRLNGKVGTGQAASLSFLSSFFILIYSISIVRDYPTIRGTSSNMFDEWALLFGMLWILCSTLTLFYFRRWTTTRNQIFSCLILIPMFLLPLSRAMIFTLNARLDKSTGDWVQMRISEVGDHNELVVHWKDKKQNFTIVSDADFAHIKNSGKVNILIKKGYFDAAWLPRAPVASPYVAAELPRVEHQNSNNPKKG